MLFVVLFFSWKKIICCCAFWFNAPCNDRLYFYMIGLQCEWNWMYFFFIKFFNRLIILNRFLFILGFLFFQYYFKFWIIWKDCLKYSFHNSICNTDWWSKLNKIWRIWFERLAKWFYVNRKLFTKSNCLWKHRNA